MKKGDDNYYKLMTKRQDTKKRFIKKQFQAKGLKQAKAFPDLFVSESGAVYNLNTGKEISRDARQAISLNGKRIKVAKLILNAYSGEKYRESQSVEHIDGNKNNLRPENLRYSQIYSKTDYIKIHPARIKQAIRCYYEVLPSFKVSDYLITKTYLSDIACKRAFFVEYAYMKNIEVFSSYINSITLSRLQVAQMYGLKTRDCNIIINRHLNTLLEDIETDLILNKLSVLDYHKQKTKRDAIKQFQEYKRNLLNS